MSMPTATTKSTRATSSLATSAKFKTFAIVFAAAGTIIYLLCLHFNWPLFTYHPAVNRIEWAGDRARAAKARRCTGTAGPRRRSSRALSLASLPRCLPENVTKKIPLILVWLLPILSVPYLIWDLRQWWLHP